MIGRRPAHGQCPEGNRGGDLHAAARMRARDAHALQRFAEAARGTCIGPCAALLLLGGRRWTGLCGAWFLPGQFGRQPAAFRLQVKREVHFVGLVHGWSRKDALATMWRGIAATIAM